MNLQEEIKRIKQIMGLITEADGVSISDMVRRDQEMRQSDGFDVEVDFTNQKELKKLLGDDPQKFLDNLNTKEDIEGVWLITQHADNDVEFQKMILDLLVKNEDTLSKRLGIPLKNIKYGIAMLTDRVMVNSSTGLKGYRDNDLDDFSEVSTGVQKYGTQGGVHNKQWVPRPIEMCGQKYFFQKPEELYTNKDFLNKINKIRGEVGLPSLEDYVKHMQKYNN